MSCWLPTLSISAHVFNPWLLTPPTAHATDHLVLLFKECITSAVSPIYHALPLTVTACTLLQAFDICRVGRHLPGVALLGTQASHVRLPPLVLSSRRVGRHLPGVALLLVDLLSSMKASLRGELGAERPQSLLLLGRPGAVVAACHAVLCQGLSSDSTWHLHCAAEQLQCLRMLQAGPSVHAWVGACVRTCVRACVHACVWFYLPALHMLMHSRKQRSIIVVQHEIRFPSWLPSAHPAGHLKHEDAHASSVDAVSCSRESMHF